MAKMTIQHQLIAGLLALGYTEAHPPRQSRKYRIFQIPTTGDSRYIFVGSNGALRVGKNGTESIQCNTVFRTKVLEASTQYRAFL